MIEFPNIHRIFAAFLNVMTARSVHNRGKFPHESEN